MYATRFALRKFFFSFFSFFFVQSTNKKKMPQRMTMTVQTSQNERPRLALNNASDNIHNMMID
jgi:hypothetical protein